MRNEHVLHQSFQCGRKSFDGVHLFRDQFVFDQDVAEELALIGITQRALVTEFLQLSDIVEDGARQQ